MGIDYRTVGLTDKAVNFLERQLGGEIKSIDRAYKRVAPAYLVLGDISEYNMETETIITVSMRPRDVEYVAHRNESIESDLVRYFTKSTELATEKDAIHKLIEKNPACKKAWDNFIMLAKLASDDPGLIEKLDKRTPL